LYKEKDRFSIEEILKITSIFPSFVGEEENEILMEELSKEELEAILATLWKYKSTSPDGWNMEFLLGFVSNWKKNC